MLADLRPVYSFVCTRHIRRPAARVSSPVCALTLGSGRTDVRVLARSLGSAGHATCRNKECNICCCCVGPVVGVRGARHLPQ